MLVTCYNISTSKYVAVLCVSRNSHELLHTFCGINFKSLVYSKYKIIFEEKYQKQLHKSFLT
jgi:hypothetical protein